MLIVNVKNQLVSEPSSKNQVGSWTILLVFLYKIILSVKYCEIVFTLFKYYNILY